MLPILFNILSDGRFMVFTQNSSAVTKVVEKDCHTVHQKLNSRFSVAARKNPLECHVLVFPSLPFQLEETLLLFKVLGS